MIRNEEMFLKKCRLKVLEKREKKRWEEDGKYLKRKRSWPCVKIIIVYGIQ